MRDIKTRVQQANEVGIKKTKCHVGGGVKVEFSLMGRSHHLSGPILIGSRVTPAKPRSTQTS